MARVRVGTQRRIGTMMAGGVITAGFVSLGLSPIPLLTVILPSPALADEAKPDSAKPDSAKVDSAKPEGAKVDGDKIDGDKIDGAKPDGSKTVYVASLNWPPYTINNNNDAGVSQEVVKHAFAAMGYTAITEYFPWARAVELGMQSPQYEGYYPAYQSPNRICTYSDPIGTGPMGLASRKEDHLTGKSLDDLKGITIGTVQGYVETEAFDNRVKQGLLTVEPATYDVLNLRKLVVGHLKLAVIDKNVMAYLLSTDPDLKGKGNLLTFDGSAMEEKSLHVCFKNNDEGRAMAAIFNAGLKKIDIQAVAEDGLKAAAEAVDSP